MNRASEAFGVMLKPDDLARDDMKRALARGYFKNKTGAIVKFALLEGYMIMERPLSAKAA